MQQLLRNDNKANQKLPYITNKSHNASMHCDVSQENSAKLVKKTCFLDFV